MKKTLLCYILTLLPLLAAAQEDPEYRLELGGGIGMVTYEGDFNDHLFKNMQPMASLLAKYRFNPRMALAMNIGYGKLKGSSRNVKTYYPELQNTPVDFNNSLIDVGARFEYNFWPYGTGREYRGAKHLTPYIFGGLGVAYAKSNKGEFAINIPLGMGVKYKLAPRLNFAAEWAMHFTGSDLLDGVKDPYGIESTGLFKNTDCFSQLRVSLTYDLWAKCKTCHNDRN